MILILSSQTTRTGEWILCPRACILFPFFASLSIVTTQLIRLCCLSPPSSLQCPQFEQEVTIYIIYSLSPFFFSLSFLAQPNPFSFFFLFFPYWTPLRSWSKLIDIAQIMKLSTSNKQCRWSNPDQASLLAGLSDWFSCVGCQENAYYAHSRMLGNSVAGGTTGVAVLMIMQTILPCSWFVSLARGGTIQ